MQLIIHFAYTGAVSVTEDNVQDLLMAADQFLITDIVQTCCKFLSKQLCPDNCIGIWRMANACFCPELQREAHRFVVEHFEDAACSEEFLQLSAQELSDIISRDDLRVKGEKAVFEAVVCWVGLEPEERAKHLVDLLSKVRIALLSTDYINLNLLCNPLVKNNPECLQMVENAKQLKLCLRNSLNASGIRNPLARPRLPHAVLFVIGGWSGGLVTNGMEAYDIRTDRWTGVTEPLERPRAYHGTAFLHGCVYCVGGFDRNAYFNSVRRFDPSARTWSDVAPMYFRRCYVSVTVLDGCIYAMGGDDGQTRLSSAERYNPTTNQWSLIPSMNEQRSDASCTTLNNKIYVCGGFSASECLLTCEYFCPKTNHWTFFSPMSSPRSGLGVIAYRDHVYAVGGSNGSEHLCSAEAYDPCTGAWQPVPSMTTIRSNFGIEVINNLLFVVGGFNGFTNIYSMEYYNAATGEWSRATGMDTFCSGIGCCVVSGVPNLDQYTAPRDTLRLINVEDPESDSSE
ncbi:uncharacterized protein V6R79_015288 [Siganus canaliculatus]